MNEEKKISEDLELEAVSYCYDNGINLSPRVATNFARHFVQWQKEQMMKQLEGWKELAIRGMKKGATLYHQGKVALITDLEYWLMED